ncbi:MAG: PilW family protein [Magnetococcus sp. DMHC-6]
MAKYRLQCGFTLLELLITLTLTSFMVMGVLTLFGGVSHTYSLVSTLSEIQDNGRFAINFLSQDLRQAGFYGTLSSPTQVIMPASLPTYTDPECKKGDANEPDWVKNIRNPIYGFDQIDYDPAVFFLDCIPTHSSNSDIMVLKMTDYDPIDVGSIVTNLDYLYSDYVQGTLFRKDVDPDPTLPAVGTYWPLKSIVWYVNNNSAGVPTLYRYDSSMAQILINADPSSQWAGEPLVEGIEVMQISYGEQSTIGNFIVDYKTPDQSPNWSLITAIKVELIVRSINGDYTYTNKNTNICLDAGRNYSIGNLSYTPSDTFPDCYRRRTLTSIIQLRNF